MPDQNRGQNYHQYVQVRCTVAVQSGTEMAPSQDAKSPFTLNVRHHFDRDHPSADIDTYDLSDWVVKEQTRQEMARNGRTQKTTPFFQLRQKMCITHGLPLSRVAPPPLASPPCPLREERRLHNFWNYGIRQLPLLVVMKTKFFL